MSDLIRADEKDPKDPNFVDTGLWLVRKDNWAKVYRPTADCLSWDGAPAGTNLAIGHARGWGYVRMRVSGRKEVEVIPGLYGFKVQIVWYQSDWKGNWYSENLEGYIVSRDPTTRHHYSIEEVKDIVDR